MTAGDADSAVTQFVALMDRVHDMILARRDPHEVIALLRQARPLLDRAEAAVGELRTQERAVCVMRFRTFVGS